MGIFLLQFLMKAADQLVGKGLDWIVIVQLVCYNLAWMVVLVVPMSVLVATLMAFGSMSQNNEITILKASGVSLLKMISTPFISSIAIAYLLVLFNNDVLPDANHHAKMLMYDISQKKPTLSLQPGVFSQEVNNYAILARGIDQNSNMLYGVTIYDYSSPSKINIVTAKEGKIYFSPDLSKLLMDLNSGEIHESETDGTSMYRKLLFKRHRIAMNAEQFAFQQSNEMSRGDREMSAATMRHRVDSLLVIKTGYDKYLNADIQKYFYGDSLAKRNNIIPPYGGPAMKYQNIINEASFARNTVVSSATRSRMIQTEINRMEVEIYKKYAIPFACVIFILLGAPLGIMIRKGGFGMAGSISLFFFLVYWAFLIGGEKLADRGIISPFWGMWAGNVLMGALGVGLTYKSMKETVTLEFDFLKKLVPKNWRSTETVTNENT
jgi:lipopolysaccharide export system permease protein